MAGSFSYAMRRNTQLWMASAIASAENCRKLFVDGSWTCMGFAWFCMVLHALAAVAASHSG